MNKIITLSPLLNGLFILLTNILYDKAWGSGCFSYFFLISFKHNKGI